MCAKNYENWLAVDKVTAKFIRLTFLAHHVCMSFTSISQEFLASVAGATRS